MPELPDVEVYRKEAEKAKNTEIENFEAEEGKLVAISKSIFSKKLKGHRFIETNRRGKYLFLSTDNNQTVVMHFGMTGNLQYLKENEEEPKYSKCWFQFKNSHKLYYISRRKLGHVEITDNLDEYIKKKELAVDAMEMSEEDFLSALKNKNSMLKTAITDQSTIAGIGNVYADEILYQTKMHPKKNTADLNESDLKNLYKNMRKVLEKAVAKNADVSSLPETYLLPHRKEGDNCPKCNGKINKITVSGRTTFYCPSCQKE